MTTTTDNLRIKRAKYSEYKQEISELIAAHWAEVGMPGTENLKIDIDEDLYLAMEQANSHLGFVLLDNQEVIGYLSIFIYNHHQHKSTVFAQTDGFFVNPKKRRYSTFKKILEIFKQAETILKQEFGVSYFMMNTNASNDLKFLADCLDYTQSAIVYAKGL